MKAAVWRPDGNETWTWIWPVCSVVRSPLAVTSGLRRISRTFLVGAPAVFSRIGSVT